MLRRAVTRSCALRAPPTCAAPAAAAAAETCARASPAPSTHGGGGCARGCCSPGVGEAHARSRAASTGGRRITRSTGAQEHRHCCCDAAEFLYVYVCRTCSRVRPRPRSTRRRVLLHAGVRKKLPDCLILSYRLVSQPAPARPLPPPAPPSMRLAAAALLLAVACCPASAFPVYASVNGSVTVESAFGGDVVFAPSAGGALQALKAFDAPYPSGPPPQAPSSRAASCTPPTASNSTARSWTSPCCPGWPPLWRGLRSSLRRQPPSNPPRSPT